MNILIRITRLITCVYLSLFVVLPAVAEQDIERFINEYRLPNGKIPNGYPCFGEYSNNECDSGYCAQLGPTLKEIPMKWCFAAATNCPAPGQHGIMFEGEYNFDGSHWYCKKGVGLLHDGPERESGKKGISIESRIGKRLGDAAEKYLNAMLP